MLMPTNREKTNVNEKIGRSIYFSVFFSSEEPSSVKKNHKLMKALLS